MDISTVLHLSFTLAAGKKTTLQKTFTCDLNIAKEDEVPIPLMPTPRVNKIEWNFDNPEHLRKNVFLEIPFSADFFYKKTKKEVISQLSNLKWEE